MPFTGAITGLAAGAGAVYATAGGLGGASYLYGFDPADGVGNAAHVVGNGEPYMTAGSVGSATYLYAVDPTTGQVDSAPPTTSTASTRSRASATRRA